MGTDVGLIRIAIQIDGIATSVVYLAPVALVEWRTFQLHRVRLLRHGAIGSQTSQDRQFASQRDSG